VYDPFGSWVQDCGKSEVRTLFRGGQSSYAMWRTYLSKQSASKNALSCIEPIDDRICVLLHRGSKNHERVPRRYLGQSHGGQRPSAQAGVAEICHTHLAQKIIYKRALVYVVGRAATAHDNFYGV